MERGLVSGRAGGVVDGIGGGRLRDLALMATPLVAELVMRDSEKPGRKSGVGAEMREAPVRLQKSFLCEVVGPRAVAASELAQEGAYGGLMTADEFTESSAVIVNEYAGDEFLVGRVHAWGWRDEASVDRDEKSAVIAAFTSNATPMPPVM